MEEDKAIGIQTESVSEMTCSHCNTLIDVSGIESFSEIQCPSCSKEEIVPARLGPFRLVRPIGSGGMGAIYHAIDDSLNRNVAIKVMLKAMGEDPESLETFQREARMCATLNHPNVVQIYSFGEEAGQPYIVMELVPGETLDDMIVSEEPIRIGRVLQIAIDVTKGLRAADDMGLVHGDVKPKNILLDSNKTAKVVDFGLATFADKAAAEDGIWGTPYYIAPEKVRKQPADARSDIYSLGGTIYHALTGQPPFEGETPVDVVKARLTNPPPAPNTLRNDIPKRVNDLVMRMLDKTPSLRHPTYASLLSDLESALEQVKKDSGFMGVQSGVKVVTKKMKRQGTQQPSKPSVRPAKKRKGAASTPKKSNPVPVIIGVVSVLIVIFAAVTIAKAHGDNQRKQEMELIKDDFSEQYTKVSTYSAEKAARARSALPKIKAFAAGVSQDYMRAHMYIQRATEHAEKAQRRAGTLEEIVTGAKQAKAAIEVVTDPRIARKYKTTLKSLDSKSQAIGGQVDTLLDAANKNIEKAVAAMK